MDPLKDGYTSTKNSSKVVYVEAEGSYSIPIEKDWFKEDTFIYINMRLPNSPASTIAEITKWGSKSFVGPFLLYIKALSTEKIELSDLPLHFDDSEIFIIQKSSANQKQYTMKTLQTHIIKVNAKPKIECICVSNLKKSKYICTCNVSSRPLGNITVETIPFCAYEVHTTIYLSEFSYHHSVSNVTIEGLTGTTEISICVNYNDPHRYNSCYKLTVTRFPRNINKVIFYCVSIPAFLLLLIPCITCFIKSQINKQRYKINDEYDKKGLLKSRFKYKETEIPLLDEYDRENEPFIKGNHISNPRRDINDCFDKNFDLHSCTAYKSDKNNGLYFVNQDEEIFQCGKNLIQL